MFHATMAVMLGAVYIGYVRCCLDRGYKKILRKRVVLMLPFSFYGSY